MDRHGRQTSLAEVGVEGRTRIAAACVDVPLDVPLDGLAATVAARYLAGAGVGRLRVASEAVAAQARAIDGGVAVEVDASLGTAGRSLPSFLALRDPSADSVAQGAHTALVALRRVLGVGA
jgi:hypothetical protein